MSTRFLVVAKMKLIFAIRILICVDFVRKPAEIVGKVYFHSKYMSSLIKNKFNNKHTYQFPNKTILISECLSHDDCPLDNKPFCTNGICTGIEDFTV